MDYISIRVSTLRGDQKIAFNAYVKINEKMVLYLRKGDSFEGDRLKKLKDKKLKKMFIDSAEESHYRNYLQTNIESAYDNKSNKDLSTRSEIIQGAQQGKTEEVFENPENAQVYAEAKEAAGKYIDFLLTNAQATQHILGLENNDQSLAHHGVTVATMAVSLAQKIGNIDPKRTQLLALGAFLHDFGHQGSTLNLKQKLSEMSADDKKIWKAHGTLGAQKVQDKKHFDQVVISIINQHEENLAGEGPLGLREKEIDPLALITSAANAVDRMITFEGIPRDEVAKQILVQLMGKYSLDHLQFLSALLKVAN